MTFLYVLLGIILFFVVLFSVNLGVIIDYGEKTIVKIKWLFLKIKVFDSSKPKKEKPPKNEKTAKEKNKKGADAEVGAEPNPQKTKKPKKSAESNEAKPLGNADTTSAQIEESAPQKAEKGKNNNQGNSLIKQIYLDHGYDGLEKMLRALGKSLGGFFGKLYKTFTIDELYIRMVTAGSDAADTAIKHGKLCSWLYPALGKLVSTCKVKKYDVDISPDFLAQKSSAEAYARFHIKPIKLTNAVVVLAFQLAFKILFKILFSKKKSDNSKKLATAVNESIAETVQKNNK